MNSELWLINAPTVVSEIIDGELVVINLAKGSYYSSTGVGAFVWKCLEASVDRAGIEAAVAGGFGIPVEQVRADLEPFFEALLSEQLVRRAPSSADPVGVLPAISDSSYAPPELKVFSDMQDLLLIDPIHEVGEQGWPTRPTEAAQ